MLFKSFRRMYGFKGQWRWKHHFLQVTCLLLLAAVLPTALSYFLGDTKAVLNGCEDHWTLQDRAAMPLLFQMTVCVDIRVVVPGAWVAFSYSSVHAPKPELGLEGDNNALYGWLLRVRHRFPLRLSPTHWHRVCLRRDVLHNSFSLEVDGQMVAERTVIAQAIPPSGSLWLGCRPRDRSSGAKLGQVELYLFRMWADLGDHGLCEDGTVIGWDARYWGVTSPNARHRDPYLLCDHRRLRRGAGAPGNLTSGVSSAITTTFEKLFSSPSEVPSTTSGPVIATPDSHMSNQRSVASVSTSTGNNAVTPVTPLTTASSTDSPSNATALPFTADPTTVETTNSQPAPVPAVTSDHTATTDSMSPPVRSTSPFNPSLANQVSTSTQTSSITALPALHTTPGGSLTWGSSLVNCNISQLCSNEDAYFWMFISVEAKANRTTNNVKNLVSDVFGCGGLKDFCQGGQKLKVVEVSCGEKNIRNTTCSVLLQLSHAVSACDLQRAGVYALQQAENIDNQFRATIIGEVERVGRNLCEDLKSDGGNFVRCTSTSSLDDICQSNTHSKLRCSLIELKHPNPTPEPETESCSWETPRFCDCTAFCNSASQFFAIRININKASVHVDFLKRLLSTFTIGSMCRSRSSCEEIQKFYKGAHLECHGTKQRLYSCMVILEMSGPVDGCSLSKLMQELIDRNSGLTNERPLAHMVMCGSPGLPVATLLASNLTWVASDLLSSDVCEPDPTLLKCEANETLAVLLTDSCSPEPPTTKQSTTQPSTTTNINITPISEALPPSVTNEIQQTNMTTVNTAAVQQNNASQGTAQPNMATSLTTMNTTQSSTAQPVLQTTLQNISDSKTGSTTVHYTESNNKTLLTPTGNRELQNTTAPQNTTEFITLSSVNPTQPNTTMSANQPILQNTTTVLTDSTLNTTLSPNHTPLFIETAAEAFTPPTDTTAFSETTTDTVTPSSNYTTMDNVTTTEALTPFSNHTIVYNITTANAVTPSLNYTTVYNVSRTEALTSSPNHTIVYNITAANAFPPSPNHSTEYNGTTAVNISTTIFSNYTTEYNVTVYDAFPPSPNHTTGYSVTAAANNYTTEYNVTTATNNYTTEYNITATTNNYTTEYSVTTVISNYTTEYNVTTAPTRVASNYTTASNSYSTEYNVTAAHAFTPSPNNTTEYNVTTATNNYTTEYNVTTATNNYTTEYNVTTTTNNYTTEYSVTTVASNYTTASNSYPTEYNVTAANAFTPSPNNTTEYNVTTASDNYTTEDNVTTAVNISTTIFSNYTTVYNVTVYDAFPPSPNHTTAANNYTTEYNVTTATNNYTTEYNITATTNNYTTEYNVTTVISNYTTEYNVTTAPTRVASNYTTASNSYPTEYNVTAAHAFTPSPNNTTEYNVTTASDNYTTKYNVSTATNNYTTEYNVTTATNNYTTEYNVTTATNNYTTEYNVTTATNNYTTEYNITATTNNYTTEYSVTTVISNYTTEYNVTTAPTRVASNYTTASNSYSTEYNVTAAHAFTPSPNHTTEYNVTTASDNYTTKYNVSTATNNYTTEYNVTTATNNYTTEYNITATTNNYTTEYSVTTVISNYTTEYNVTTAPTRVASNYTTASNSYSTEYNVTAAHAFTPSPNHTTEYNVTTASDNYTTEYNVTTAVNNYTTVFTNYTTEYNVTAANVFTPSPNHTTEYNVTTAVNNYTTASNSYPTEYNVTVAHVFTPSPNHTTEYNVTTASDNYTTEYSITTVISNYTTVSNNYTTDYSVTTATNNYTTEYNVTTTTSNYTTAFNNYTVGHSVTTAENVDNGTVTTNNATMSTFTSSPNYTTNSLTTVSNNYTTAENVTTTTVSSNNTATAMIRETQQNTTAPYKNTTMSTTAMQVNETINNATISTNTSNVDNRTSVVDNTTKPTAAPLNNQTMNHTTANATQSITTSNNTSSTTPANVTDPIINQNVTAGISSNLSSTANSLITDVNPTTKEQGVNLTTTAANASLEHIATTTTTAAATTTTLGPIKPQVNTTTAAVSSASTTILPTTTLTSTTTTTIVPGTETTSATTTETTKSQVTQEEQANDLLVQTQDVSQLNSSQVAQMVGQLEKLLDGPTVSQEVGQKAINIISNLMQGDSAALSASAKRLIQLVDNLGVKLVVSGDRGILSSNSLVLAVRTVDATNFPTTSVDIFNTDNVQLRALSRSRSKRSGSALGSVFLPSSLTVGLSPEEQQQASRVQFTFYTKNVFFQDVALDNNTLVSPVLGSSVANLSISNLTENIQFTIRNINPIDAESVVCSFWDFTLNGGGGGWSSAGCFVVNATPEETICSCNHLTSFAILLDLSREGITDRQHAQILTFITYIGCGISAIFLAVTLLTYLSFEKLLRDIPAKILVQLCMSLLFLNLVFLLDGWLALYPAIGLCISTAFFLHYFLLTSFTWAGLEALHMYLSIVQVFTPYLSRYMLKFSLMGWGIPLIIVIIIISVDKDNYGLVTYGRYTDGTSDDFCWLRNDIAFYVGVVAYFLLIFSLCLLVFIVVMVQLARIKKQNPQNQSPNRGVMTDLRSIAGLIILLGLTWGFALFAWGPLYLPFVYLFSILNSLQGFFVFVFHCAVKENVRRQWRTYLCCGRLRLAENSEWSRTATQNNRNLSVTTAMTSAPHFTSRSSSVISDVTNSSGSVFADSGISDGSNSDVVLNELHRRNLSLQGEA